METFSIHTVDTAPEQSKQALQRLQQSFGFIPNAAATMAGSPVLINAFIGSFASFHGGSFGEAEKRVLLLTNAVALECRLDRGVSLHDRSQGGRWRERRCSPFAAATCRLTWKLAALSALAKTFMESNGRTVDAEIGNFFASGYTQTQVLEVIAGIAISTMAGLMANVANTPVEDRFKAQAWNQA